MQTWLSVFETYGLLMSLLPNHFSAHLSTQLQGMSRFVPPIFLKLSTDPLVPPSSPSLRCLYRPKSSLKSTFFLSLLMYSFIYWKMSSVLVSVSWSWSSPRLSVRPSRFLPSMPKFRQQTSTSLPPPASSLPPFLLSPHLILPHKTNDNQ